MSQHSEFQERVRKSVAAVQVVADHLQLEGYEIDIPELSIAPTASQAKEHADHGDLFVTDRKAQFTWRYEVKGLSAVFTCAANWPFPEVLVDRRERVDKVERDGESPLYYYSVNKARTHIAIIETATTRAHWYISTKRNSNTGNVEDFYACPTGLVIFQPLKKEGA
jgi:hypothetical protein